MRSASLGLFLLVLSACRTELLDPLDLSSADHAMSGVDLAQHSDLSTPTDLPLCAPHVLQPIAIDAIEVLGGDDAVVKGRVLRLLITYPLQAGCDVPADVLIQIEHGNATDVVSLTARVWHTETGCGASQGYARVVELTTDLMSNPMMSVRDTVGPTAGAAFAVATNPNMSCTTTKDIGAACTRDCECQANHPRASCITQGAGQATCGYSCSGDSDCSGLTGTPICSRSDDYVCVPLMASFCRTDADCPVGQQAVDCACRPRPLDGGPFMCGCDTDCPVGLICTGFGCTRTCSTARDCPGVIGESACSEGVCLYPV